MPTCIYCKRDSGESRAVPHVMPEILVRNQLTLPIGTECDACNAYAGNKLDVNLARHPSIASAIQFLGAPGKRGKPREQLGGIGRKRVDPEHVEVSLRARGRLTIEPGGSHVIHGSITPEAGFNFRRFRRALHHIALNYVAAADGADAALNARYDAARKYVKNPCPASESWPYGEVIGSQLQRVTGVGYVEYQEIQFVQIFIFQMTFIVDLLRSGLLSDLTRGLGGTFVTAEAAEPPAVTITIGAKLKTPEDK